MLSEVTQFFNAYSLYFFIGLLALFVGLGAWVTILHRKIKTIFRGDSTNLDELLLSLRKGQDDAKSDFSKAVERVDSLEKLVPKNISRVGLVRHNPFSDVGGDQSFVLALLNDEHSGIVLSSFYGRSMNRVYAKTIYKGKSKHPFSEEEEQAITDALNE
jgi:hypothetical protein